MHTITLRPEKADAIVPRLVRITDRHSIRVKVEGGLSPQSAYAQCLLQGSLRKLGSEGKAIHGRGPDILEKKMHEWQPGGFLVTQ